VQRLKEVGSREEGEETVKEILHQVGQIEKAIKKAMR